MFNSECKISFESSSKNENPRTVQFDNPMDVWGLCFSWFVCLFYFAFVYMIYSTCIHKSLYKQARFQKKWTFVSRNSTLSNKNVFFNNWIQCIDHERKSGNIITINIRRVAKTRKKRYRMILKTKTN